MKLCTTIFTVLFMTICIGSTQADFWEDFIAALFGIHREDEQMGAMTMDAAYSGQTAAEKDYAAFKARMKSGLFTPQDAARQMQEDGIRCKLR
jgi:hypothetical protein